MHWFGAETGRQLFEHKNILPYISHWAEAKTIDSGKKYENGFGFNAKGKEDPAPHKAESSNNEKENTWSECINIQGKKNQQ